MLLCPWDFPGKNTEVGCCILLQVIFWTQGSNQRLLCLLRCRQILYLLSHWGRPECRIGCIQQQQRSFGWYITFIYYWFTHTRSLKQREKKANGWRQSWGFGEIVGIYIKNLGWGKSCKKCKTEVWGSGNHGKKQRMKCYKVFVAWLKEDPWQ